jgi:hypothetical protein
MMYLGKMSCGDLTAVGETFKMYIDHWRMRGSFMTTQAIRIN